MKNSTIDLHNIKQDIFLGFLSQQKFDSTQKNYELSFFGGEPIWLHQPSDENQMCSQCNVNLCFLGQIYCPFDADHCFHRVLYFLFCEKCIRQFRCIRQQSEQNFNRSDKIVSKVKKICAAKQIYNDSYYKYDLTKLINKIRSQVQEQSAIQEAESEDEEDAMDQMNNEQIQKYNKYDFENEQKEEKDVFEEQAKQRQNRDVLFQIYKKAIVELENPCMLYTDTPIPYNSRVLNPQHFCKCGSKLSLEVQITERILNMDNNPNSKLLLMDWGSIMIYTCGASCKQSNQQCVVVQYEIDAVTDEDIKKLNQKRKNKKKKEQKQKSKSKSKSNQKSQSKEKKVSQNTKNQQQKKENDVEKKEEGDWD